MAGLCFYGTVTLSQYGIQSVQGALFILITENTFAPMYSALTLFPQRYPLFMRERQAGLYNTFQYYFTSIVALVRNLNMYIWDAFFSLSIFQQFRKEIKNERIGKKSILIFDGKKYCDYEWALFAKWKKKRCKQIPTYTYRNIDIHLYTILVSCMCTSSTSEVTRKMM